MDARTQTGAAGAATGSPTLDARMGALHVQADTVSRSVFDIVAMLAERESALKEQKSALESETGKQEAALQALHDRLRRELASERQALDVEKAFVAAASSSQLVVLSVGGTKFTARRDTLARAPGFFGALFSGRHTVPAQEDGSYFIERDPTHFSLILRWLSDGRDNFSALPRATKIALAEEADYYALDDLLTAINGTDHLRALSEGDAAIRREENLRRAAFARCESLVRAASIAQAAATPLPEAPRDDLDDDAPMPSFSAAARPFLTPLTSLRLSATRRRDEASEWAERVREACNHIHNGFYDFRDVLAIAASTAVGQLLPFRRVTHSPAGYPLLFEQFAAHHNELEPSQCVLVRTLDEWKLAFSRHNPDILDRLGSVSCPARCKWVIAGGSVLRALLRRPPAAAAFDDTDVDIFIVAEEAADATRLAESIWCALAADGEEWVLSRGQYVINMIRSGGELASAAQPPVQIVLRLYESPSEVLHGFDVDPCAVAFDGEGLHALPRAIEALRTGYGVLNPLHAWPTEPTYELRLAKYAGRGFAVAVPGLQWHLVDRKAVNAALVDLKGLSRLLLLDAERSRALHQLRALNTPLPSLKHVFGRVRFFSNYGAHTRSRELPTQYHDARHLTNISWDNYMTDPGDATANAPDASAWWLVVPCHQLESEEVMNADARAEHWAIILDADRENLRIPRELEWSTTPRTREYLNAGEVGLEQRYFASVYSRRRSSGARRGRDSL
ncbi:hypothetical protein EMIHUDRAFT_236138 [Emiliania huxleyi CCMP1516]|uniref:BTB domain-containing protein n=2 Tax=Emiliania huxleyi TaxID=2903 RepID=A0A0D3JU63_EMIH1|nr:hypothetical protein EMIHUDRAFT_236138 [Emiliania huxleyi CCMP1516]EOD27048.1 hypothetical protein EMIHUDRAFT_236138 [Emiliania huxleyi CCMP1516]|eukprot:XP_005779477.1 hypothetical protein EMIHUDRAFT_236138 [Emiliania huxleyi CCMP1516]